jgi:hypothetical protein
LPNESKLVALWQKKLKVNILLYTIIVRHRVKNK